MRPLFAASLILAAVFTFAVLMPQVLFGEEYTYYSKGKRDPFVSLINTGARTSLGLEAVEAIEDIKFEGVIYDPRGESMAMLNGEAVKTGDKIFNVEIVKIYEHAISIKIYDKDYTINLIEEGGEAVGR